MFLLLSTVIFAAGVSVPPESETIKMNRGETKEINLQMQNLAARPGKETDILAKLLIIPPEGINAYLFEGETEFILPFRTTKDVHMVVEVPYTARLNKIYDITVDFESKKLNYTSLFTGGTESVIHIEVVPSKSDYETIFRLAVKDFLSNPSSAKSTLSEIKDMWDFYKATQNFVTANYLTAGSKTGSTISNIINNVEVKVGGCTTNSGCGTTGYTTDYYCKNGDVYRDYIQYTCLNPGKTDARCDYVQSNKLIDDCEAKEECKAGVSECQPCTETWQCSSWSKCINWQQTRTCSDSKGCGTIQNKPVETQSCTCTESWSCTDWGSCTDGKLTRTCTDSYKCGTTKNKPAETYDLAASCDLFCFNSNSGYVITDGGTFRTGCSDSQYLITYSCVGKKKTETKTDCLAEGYDGCSGNNCWISW